MPAVQRPNAPEWLIIAGALIFIAILTLSAYWERDLVWLHFFQAWMYVAAIALSLRRSRAGYFIGLAAAGFWDYVNLAVTTFFANGLEQAVIWARTGHVARPDQLIAVPAWGGNLLVIIGSLWAYGRLGGKRRSDFAVFVVLCALTTAFFAADMALFQPRYLALFPRSLHPHLP